MPEARGDGFFYAVAVKMKIAKDQLRLLNRATLIPLLMVCSLAILLVLFQKHISKTDHLLKQTDEVIKQARRTQLLLLLMESNYNSYVVTRREEFLKQYHVARNEVPESIFHLGDSVVRTGGVNQFAELDIALRQWVAHSESLFGKPVPEAIKTFESPEFQRIGNMYLNGLRNAFEGFINAQVKLRNRQMKIASQARDDFLISGVFLLISVALFLAIYFRKQLEAAFQKYELQTRRLRESRNELRQTVKTRDQALSSRDEFIKIASHELNTPLQALKLQTQMIQKEAVKNGSLSPEKLQKFLGRTDSQVDRLTVLVKDMLEITQMGKGAVTLQPSEIALTPLLQQIREKLSPLAEQSGSPIEIHSPDDIVGQWDTVRIEQVLYNLISNAVKYGRGRPISIEAEEKEGWVKIEVKDQGIGIPQEAQERIFQRFERNISASEVSGMGLGLFITKELVSAHAGRIWVESKGHNQGSKFSVEIPRNLKDNFQHVPRQMLTETLEALSSQLPS